MRGNTHNKNMITGQQKTVEWHVKEIVSVICIYDWLLFTSVVFLQSTREWTKDLIVLFRGLTVAEFGYDRPFHPVASNIFSVC